MKMLILDDREMGRLAKLNEGNASLNRTLTAVELRDETWGIGADLLGDCGTGQTWEAWGELLRGLRQREVDAGEIYDYAGAGFAEFMKG